MSKKPRGIFCLEGPWSPKLTDRSSMRPVLEILENRKEAKFIHRDVSTREELASYLEQWTEKQYKDFSILHFSSHGSTGGIHLGRKFVGLDEIADVFEGRCKGRVIHFDSCETLDLPLGEIQAFRKVSGATAVTGFTKSIEWMPSAAFTLNLFYELAPSVQVPAALRRMKELHGRACKEFGFRAVWEGGQIQSRTTR